MEFFYNAKIVRLRSHHDKYLIADDDELSVSQDRNGSSRKAKWMVEFIEGSDNAIRLKSCYGLYLTASYLPFLLGVKGRKVLQTLPHSLDTSVEWKPIKGGSQVRLMTRYGKYLRANGGLPPWRNSVTHDVPHRTSTQDWVIWDVDVLEVADHSSVSVDNEMEDPNPQPTQPPGHGSDNKHQAQESSDSGSFSSSKHNGRQIYYRVADEYGVDESVTEKVFTFEGRNVTDLAHKLEKVTGLEDIFACMRNPLNGKLYPLLVQLPPNSSSMHIVVVSSTSTLAEEFF